MVLHAWGSMVIRISYCSTALETRSSNALIFPTNYITVLIIGVHSKPCSAVTKQLENSRIPLQNGKQMRLPQNWYFPTVLFSQQ